MRRPLLDRLRSLLSRPRATRWVLLVALLVALPTLPLGLQVDDHWHAIFLHREPARYAVIAKPPLDVFNFFDGDPARTRHMIEQGWVPWWTDVRVRLSFLRPVSAATHWLDHRAWPRAPWLMHLHSIAWYLAVVAAAAAVIRRAMARDAAPGGRAGRGGTTAAAPWAAALAAYLYAVDSTHGIPLGWVANRNALVAATFGLLAVALHDRAQREGSLPARVASPLALGVAVFAGESGVAAVGYLVAYALCLDGPGAGARRGRLAALLALAPHLAVAAAWAAVYSRGRYGAAHSAMYLHPAREPLAFARAALERFPLLAAGELGAPPPDLYPFAPPAARVAIMAVALAAIALALRAAWPLLRERASARFFLLGSALALVPACATSPSARLLLLPGLGLLALQAQTIAAWMDGAPALRAPRAGRLVRGYVAYVAVGHALLSPLLLQFTARQMDIVERKLAALGRSLGADPRLADQHLVIANGPDFFSTYILLTRLPHDLPEPARTTLLASGLRAVTLERTDLYTLRISREEGLLAGETTALLCDPRGTWRAGDRVSVPGVTFTVRALGPDGRPALADARFDEPLESPRYRFVQWLGRALAPLALPPPGGRVTLAAQPLVP